MNDRDPDGRASGTIDTNALNEARSHEAWQQTAAATPVPMPKILLEGTSLTLKTDIAFALSEHPRVIGHRKHRWHLPLVSSEWETHSGKPPTKSEPGHSMIDFPPHEQAWAMEAYHAWLRIFELHRDHYWILDRFHISTRSYQMTKYAIDYPLEWVDERLAALNFRLVHLVREPESFSAARVSRLKYSESPWKYDDLGAFIAEQDRLRHLIKTSTIQSREFDVSDNDANRVAGEILDWVEDSGGMWWN